MNKPSEWKVTSNPIEDVTLYRVYRIRDTSEVDHSGNREYVGNYTQDREKARIVADLLNGKAVPAIAVSNALRELAVTEVPSA